ncbi:hypothetical protein QDR37_13265 [Amnibacterium sp. CER49]|uniref:hypothetical protein n=1 Tax=Amnibacterium sp. CER49 TaxID=3039161 RepID=UPI00244D515B|nr:hypothetical protein [Amnibacterium sp. CER49]MDH2444919.1 hypothetical protein [Amnibacterium sp. CER49]
MAESMTVEQRIAHFLRLSQDPGATQAERDTAGQQAERLLAKHAIDRLTLDVEGAKRAQREPIETGVLVVHGGRGTVALDVVLGLSRVATALGLVPYFSDRRTPDPWDPEGTPHVRLSVSGFRSDVALALPLLESLHTQAVLAMRAWWRGDARHRLVPRWDAHLARCAFVQSFGDGAAARLRTARDEAVATTGTALVVASREAEVRGWVDDNVRLRTRTDRRSFSGYGRGQGYAAGLRSTGTTRRGVHSPSGG